MKRKKLNIGFLAVNDKPTTELACGGTEVFVSALARELAKRGHEITVFAAEGSAIVGTRVIPTTESLDTIQAKLESNGVIIQEAERAHISHVLALRNIAEAKKHEMDIDIFHDNSGSPVIQAALDLLDKPVVVTLHMPLNFYYQSRELTPYLLHQNLHCVAISHYQQQQFPQATQQIYNGTHVLAPSVVIDYEQEDYVWVGRIDPSTPKGLDIASLVSKQQGKRLNYVGFVEDQNYFDTKIGPQLGEHVTRYPQFASLAAKSEFYAQHKIAIIPIECEEAFGLTFIEAMAAGTPVITYARGAAAEVVADGYTGYVINPSETDIRGEFQITATGIEGIQAAVAKIEALSPTEYAQLRSNCRQWVQENFSIERMADQYEKYYLSLVK